MKLLIPFALAGAVSFAAVAGSTATADEALACGNYRVDVDLAKAEAALAVQLLEKQVGDRMAAIATTLSETPRRRLLSRAAPRPESFTSVVVFSYERPTKATSVLGNKTVRGDLALRKPDGKRVVLPYRIGLTKQVVELRRGDAWVLASSWTPVEQKAADVKESTKQKASQHVW